MLKISENKWVNSGVKDAGFLCSKVVGMTLYIIQGQAWLMWQNFTEHHRHLLGDSLECPFRGGYGQTFQGEPQRSWLRYVICPLVTAMEGCMTQSGSETIYFPKFEPVPAHTGQQSLRLGGLNGSLPKRRSRNSSCWAIEGSPISFQILIVQVFPWLVRYPIVPLNKYHFSLLKLIRGSFCSMQPKIKTSKKLN